jgi:deoxyribonuclease-4
MGEAAAHVTLRAEVMGKSSQFGDLDEILRVSQAVPGVEPCIDIAHLHARTSACNSSSEFARLWSSVGDALGPGALRRAHIHISGIDYGPSGEKRHLPLAESDLDYRAFLESLIEFQIGGRMIVESPAREDDVFLIHREWRRVVGGA